MRQLLLLLACAATLAAATPPAALVQDCTRPQAPGSVCYGGPMTDDYGQIVSSSVPGTVAWTFDTGAEVGCVEQEGSGTLFQDMPVLCDPVPVTALVSRSGAQFG